MLWVWFCAARAGGVAAAAAPDCCLTGLAALLLVPLVVGMLCRICARCLQFLQEHISAVVASCCLYLIPHRCLVQYSTVLCSSCTNNRYNNHVNFSAKLLWFWFNANLIYAQGKIQPTCTPESPSPCRDQTAPHRNRICSAYFKNAF